MGYIKLDSEVEKELGLIINDFSFYNGLYKKFENVFLKLKLCSVTDKVLSLSPYRKTYWTLFVLSHKYVLDKRSDIVDSVCLLGALFYWVLQSGEIKSHKISKSTSSPEKGDLNNNNPLLDGISNLLNFRDMERFEHLLNDLINYLQRLRLKEVLNENWGSSTKIQVLCC